MLGTALAFRWRALFLPACWSPSGCFGRGLLVVLIGCWVVAASPSPPAASTAWPMVPVWSLLTPTPALAMLTADTVPAFSTR